jgi:lipoate-protein ligase A
VHHHEWTYSVAVPVGRNQVGAAPHLYDIVHDALVAGLRQLGWDASKWTAPCAAAAPVSAPAAPADASAGCGSGPITGGPAAGGSVGGGQPHFLCFSRRSCGDIVCDGFKVVGSAQRRLGSSVVQHGSILLARSEFAPELPGLGELPRDAAIAADDGAEVGAGNLRQYLQGSQFAELVASWLTTSLSKQLGITFERLPAPPGRSDQPKVLPRVAPR